jgi:fibronectin-binding autotransporter adhesin
MTSRVILYRSIVTALSLAALCLPTRAATFVWDTNTMTTGAQDGPGTWVVGMPNWFDQTDSLQNQPWSNGNDAVFGAGSGAAGTVTLGGPITANSLTFNAAGSGTYTLTGNTLTLTTGAITANAAATINSILAGSQGLTLSGGSAITLGGSGSNTYTGSTTINAGSLILDKTGGAIAIAGSVQVNTGGTLTYDLGNQIASTASLTVAGGTLNFEGQSQTLQELTMSSGTLATGNAGPASTLTINDTLTISGGAATLNSGATVNAQTVAFSGSGSLLIGANTVTQLIVGSGGLSLGGDIITMNLGTTGNQIVLNGDVTASGTNSIIPGTGTATAGTINAVAIGSSARNFDITAGTTSISVVITGSGGSLTKTGAGILVFNGAVANTYTSTTIVSAGTLSLAKTAGATAIAGNILVNGGTLSLAANNQIAVTSTATVTSGTFSLNGFSQTIADVVINGGTFNTLTGIGTVTGAISILGGLSSGLTVNSGGSLTATAINLTGGGILMGGSSTTLSTLTIGTGGISMTGQTISINPATAGFAGTQITLDGTFTASGTNNITLGGAIPAGAVDQLLIGSSAANFDITSGLTTVNIAIVGSGENLVKEGAGQLSLLANNTFTGSAIVTGGSLLLSSGTATQGALSGATALAISGDGYLQDGSPTAASNNGIVNAINPAATLTLGGSAGNGAFTMAFAATTQIQTLASLTIGQGANSINTANTPAGTLSLAFTGSTSGAGYVRNVGGSVNFVSAAGFTVSLTNAPTAAGGSSVSGSGSAAILVGAVLNGTDFIAAQAGALAPAAYTSTGTSTWTAGQNMDVTGSVTATAATPINSLHFGTAGAFTVSLTGVQTIGSGMILVNGNVGANLSTVTGGTLEGSAGGDLLLLQYNTAGGLTIGSTIADNTSSTGLTVAGSGVVTLTAANSYTGQTYLNSGTLQISANSALGNAATGAQINFDGGTLATTGSFSLDNSGSNARNLVLANGGGTLSPATGTLTVDGTVSGTGSLTMAGASTLLLTGANTYTGGTVLTTGTLQLGSSGALGGGGLVLNGGALQAIGAARTVTGPVTLQANSSIVGSLGITFSNTLTMSGGSYTITNSLATGSLLMTGNVFLSNGVTVGSQQLTFAGAGYTEIDGVIADNNGVSTAPNGVTLNSTGTLDLTGANTYSGRTISAGGGAIIVQADQNFGLAPASPVVDSIILAQLGGTIEIQTGFTLNANRDIGIGASTGGAYTGNINVLSGQTFTVPGVIADRTLNANGQPVAAANVGSLAKLGAGTLVLSGQNTYSGNTTVTAGTLVVTGSIGGSSSTATTVSVASGATLGLSGSGTITAGALTLNNTSTLSLQVDAVSSNTITLSDAATLAGSVTLALALTAQPMGGTLFTLIDGGSPLVGYSTGARFDVNGAAVADGGTFTVATGGFSQQFEINYGDGNPDVTILALPEPGGFAALLGPAGLLLAASRFRRRSKRLAIST